MLVELNSSASDVCPPFSINKEAAKEARVTTSTDGGSNEPTYIAYSLEFRAISVDGAPLAPSSSAPCAARRSSLLTPRRPTQSASRPPRSRSSSGRRRLRRPQRHCTSNCSHSRCERLSAADAAAVSSAPTGLSTLVHPRDPMNHSSTTASPRPNLVQFLRQKTRKSYSKFPPPQRNSLQESSLQTIFRR